MTTSRGNGVAQRISRDHQGRPVAPVRLVHLGVGSFFRAHQAWYTEHAPDVSDWGYAAFTGRSATVADVLGEQDGLYTLLVREPDASVPEVVSVLSAVHPGDDVDALRGYLASPDVAVVTTTVTEAGYRRNGSGGLDVDAEPVRQDIAVLTGEQPGEPSTTPGRLVDGLRARRAAGAGPLAIVPCDNVPDNGTMASRVVRDLAERVDPDLAAWVGDNVSFVTTMVDRITPRTTKADVEEVRRLTGVDDRSVVVTEPFSEWVLSGNFPAGRPRWEGAGARFVDDIHPFETRKLWMLNGAHSLLAYAGSALGYVTVADAMGDDEVRGWVEEWWSDAGRYLPLPADEVAAYRQALVGRFENPRMRHLLAQIASDGSQKVPIRVVPALTAARADGRLPAGACRVIASWVVHLRGHGAPVDDVQADEVKRLVDGSASKAVGRVLGWLELDDAEVAAQVEQQVSDLESRAS